MPAPTKACIICGKRPAPLQPLPPRAVLLGAVPAKGLARAPEAVRQESRNPRSKPAVRNRRLGGASGGNGARGACIRGRRGRTGGWQRSDRCVLTLTPMVSRRCDERECGGVGGYDRLAPAAVAAERSRRLREGLWTVCAARAPRDPAAAFSTPPARRRRAAEDCRTWATTSSSRWRPRTRRRTARGAGGEPGRAARRVVVRRHGGMLKDAARETSGTGRSGPAAATRPRSS